MNTRLKCLLLDDELPGLTYLKMLCEQIPELEVVKAFNNPLIFLEELPALEFDICILDIEMPGMNGLQVASLLKDKPVIFTTAYSEFAAEAFDLNAIDYLRKPFGKDRLHQAVLKAILRVSQKHTDKKFIQLNTDKGRALIFFDQLSYVKSSESDARDKIAYLADGSEFTLKNISFDKLLKLLPVPDFCRINKKEIISINSVKVFSFDEITSHIKTGSGVLLKFYLSEVYRQDFLKKVSI